MVSDKLTFSVDVIIPTYRPDGRFRLLLESLLSQTHLPAHIWIVNTQTDSSPLLDGEFEKDTRISVRNISAQEFDHGATRNLGASFSSADYLLFMTQDAVPCNDRLIESLLRTFSSFEVVVAYARQVADEHADPIEQLTRQFNYPKTDMVKSLADKERLGIKTYFCSNVCAMYDRSRFVELGGFPEKIIFNEDMLFAAKVMESGFKIVYSSNSEVYHSHNYTCKQHFNRYFDLAVSQRQNPQVFASVSSGKEGLRLVRYVCAGLFSFGKWWQVPYFVLQSVSKSLGFFCGYRYECLPLLWRRRLSMNQEYWRSIYSIKRN